MNTANAAILRINARAHRSGDRVRATLHALDAHEVSLLADFALRHPGTTLAHQALAPFAPSTLETLGESLARWLAGLDPALGLACALSSVAPSAGPTAWRHARGTLPLVRPLVMGIVNVTPDSFSDGGKFQDPARAIDHGLALAAEGADVLDVGGESTRPGADEVDLATELARVIPVVSHLARTATVPISVDTRKPAVAAAALDQGAAIVNDVGGLSDPAMVALLARTGAGAVAMHLRGEPRTMQADPTYRDLLYEVTHALRGAAQRATEAGIPADSIALDPGIGFGKTLDHNLELLARTRELASLGHPLLVGPSRKSFIRGVLADPDLGYPSGEFDAPEARTWGTAATVAWVVAEGASIVRVHDVGAMRQAALVAHRIARSAMARSVMARSAMAIWPGGTHLSSEREGG